MDPFFFEWKQQRPQKSETFARVIDSSWKKTKNGKENNIASDCRWNGLFCHNLSRRGCLSGCVLQFITQNRFCGRHQDVRKEFQEGKDELIGKNDRHEMDETITLATGLTTAVRREPPCAVPPSSSSSTSLQRYMIAGHGLGPKNPKNKSHLNDTWVALLSQTISTTITAGTTGCCLSYTARGHGDSHGWEETADTNPDQFTWRALSADMLAVADYYQLPSFVAAGSSMGSATALFAAIQRPDRIQGVVMIRPPTAWGERLARRKFLLSSAAKCRESDSARGDKFHCVLAGVATSDLPDPTAEGVGNEYGAIRCPVLLLTIAGDESHPVSTAEALHRAIPQSTLHIAETDKAARTEWPEIISTFLRSLPAPTCS